MDLVQQYATEISLGAAVLSLSALVICLALLARVNRFARPFDKLAKKISETSDLGELLQAQVQGVDDNRQRIEETLAYTRRLRTQSLNAVQALGFLRYDAFDDIRGQQSYSLCLLDAHQNGLLISTISGRTDSRAYAKPVVAGEVDIKISDEEGEALLLAKNSLHEVEEPIVAGL